MPEECKNIPYMPINSINQQVDINTVIELIKQLELKFNKLEKRLQSLEDYIS